MISVRLPRLSKRAWTRFRNVPEPNRATLDARGASCLGKSLMPTYEYICSKCNHTFEHSQSIANEPLTICPKELCPQKRWGKGRVKRAIVGGAGLIFKGSGFYATDYRSENYKEGAKKEAPAPAAAPATDSKASTGKGESKPAPAAAESKPAKPTTSKT